MGTTSIVQTITLAAGQSQYLAVDAGTALVVALGELRIDEAPQWLAEHLLPVGDWVGEGQTYVVAQSGWVRMTARGGARLVQAAPVGWRTRWMRWLRQWTGPRQLKRV